MENKTTPQTRSHGKNEYIRELKVASSSFKSQFSLSKLLVAAVLIVLILLGPIILITTNNIEEHQIKKIQLIVGKISPENKALIEKSLPFPLDASKITDANIHQLIEFLETHKGLAPIFEKMGVTKELLQRATISGLSFASLAQVFSTAILYALGWGIFSALKDKNMIDKNRVMYMNFSKHSVLFWKILAETAMFIFIVIVADGLGMLLVSTIGKGEISHDLIKQLSIQLIAITIFYFFIQIGMRLIVSKIQSKSIKGIVLAIWLLSTAFLYIVLSIVFGVKPETTKIIIDNKYLFAFLPIANIVVLPLVLYGTLPLWTVVPFIIYSIIPIIIVWKGLTSSVKNYLCS
ncbi:hypothetical protein C4B25_00960 [Mycoplasma todarodis]|uniref:Uncharacterized protein n=2 Tax=Mycoplasma todarodis TaxID=1937191 RepID=A0A4R0XS15_9MOLU|nr:hypothetical protein C4B25_00960 [Mycoplasma todarodis]